jgi:murein DD-endopeptidase MepM/ murein hydrolase activator NlpD
MPRKPKPIVGMRPVRWTRVTNPFAAPGSYASHADSHGPAGHHTGVDFGSHLNPYRAVEGQPVRSCTSGVVVISDYNSTMGNWVGVYYAKDDVTLTYWHMHDRNVRVGERVEQGKVLGHVGQTGNAYGAHLHLQANHGRGFNYSAHIKPWQWCHGTRWWSLFDRRKKGGRKTRVAHREYAIDTHRMPNSAQHLGEVVHPSTYDGVGADVPD